MAEKEGGRKQLCAIEDEIIDLTDKGCLWITEREVVERVSDLISGRCCFLNEMFQATPEELRRFGEVNKLLEDLTHKMYSQGAALYRSLLAMEHDKDFDDDFDVECKLTIPYNGKCSVLHLENDRFYSSRSNKIHYVISWLLGKPLL